MISKLLHTGTQKMNEEGKIGMEVNTCKLIT